MHKRPHLAWNLVTGFSVMLSPWMCSHIIVACYSYVILCIVCMAYDSMDILNSLSLTTCPMSPCTTSMVAFELVRERNAASDGAGPKCVAVLPVLSMVHGGLPKTYLLAIM